MKRFMSVCLYPMGSDGEESGDPIHVHDDGSWWFYEENWADENGPYETKDECEFMLAKYIQENLGV